MKTIIAVLLSLTSVTVHASEFPEIKGWAVAFYTNEPESSLGYTIQYPNLSNDIVEAGRQVGNAMIPDCMAFVSNSQVSAHDMLQLANALQVKEGFELERTLRPEVKNGTVLYRMTPGSFYQTKIKIETLDGESFSANEQRVLGDKAMNLRLEYRRNCYGIR